jgi:hypothetical protein
MTPQPPDPPPPDVVEEAIVPLEGHGRRYLARKRRSIEQIAGKAAAPMLGRTYQAGTLPPGSVVTGGRDTEYVIGRTGLCMRWEQPIPGSEGWLVTYRGRLPEGVWMTHRERAEVDECRPAKTKED